MYPSAQRDATPPSNEAVQVMMAGHPRFAQALIR